LIPLQQPALKALRVDCHLPAPLADQNENGSRYYGLGEGRGGIYTRPGATRGEYRPPKPQK
jgi:hypothetical protein